MIPPEQPAPVDVPGAVPVCPPLLAWLREEGQFFGVGYREAADLVEARRAVGIARYGRELHSSDGRDHYRDTVDEIGDALQYVAALHLAREMTPDRITRLLRLVEVLRYLIARGMP